MSARREGDGENKLIGHCSVGGRVEGEGGPHTAATALPSPLRPTTTASAAAIAVPLYRCASLDKLVGRY